tara:strand:+ start:5708 stop:5896 length:189 start_codon:yes stop_codon:yes gene_type:complete
MKLWKPLAIAAGTAALTTAVGYAAKRAVLTYLGRGTHNGPRLIPAVAEHVTSVANQPRRMRR